MIEPRKCCGACRYHRHESIDDGWICVCGAATVAVVALLVSERR